MIETFTVNVTAALVEKLLKGGISIDQALSSAVEDLSESVPSCDDLAIPSKEETKAALREAYVSGSLVLVLGAGVSVDYGLPSWNTLLQALLAKTFHGDGDGDERALLFAEIFNRTFEPSPLIAARYLAGQFKDTKLGFEKAIRDLLYRQMQDDVTSETMKELVQLAAAPGRSPNLDSIITYNFDDILEHEVDGATIDVPIRSIFSVGQNPKENELPIYHVHGYIPRKGRLTHQNMITLGEDLYHRQYTEVYSWANLVQLAKFKDNHCIFIGTSFTDPNQRRLLDIAATQRGDAQVQHFMIKKRYTASAIEKRLRTFLESNKDVFDRKAMQNIAFKELVEKMIDAVHRFDHNDALSLGVHTIWIDDFDEIPSVLKEMREGG